MPPLHCYVVFSSYIHLSYRFFSIPEASRRLQLQPGLLDLLHMLVQSGIERAVVTRNSPEATQVFLDKVHQELTNNRQHYPLLNPNHIFSQVCFGQLPYSILAALYTTIYTVII